MILTFFGALIQQNDLGKEVEEEGETQKEYSETEKVSNKHNRDEFIKHTCFF